MNIVINTNHSQQAHDIKFEIDSASNNDLIKKRSYYMARAENERSSEPSSQPIFTSNNNSKSSHSASFPSNPLSSNCGFKISNTNKDHHTSSSGSKNGLKIVEIVSNNSNYQPDDQQNNLVIQSGDKDHSNIRRR